MSGEFESLPLRQIPDPYDPLRINQSIETPGSMTLLRFSVRQRQLKSSPDRANFMIRFMTGAAAGWCWERGYAGKKVAGLYKDENPVRGCGHLDLRLPRRGKGEVQLSQGTSVQGYGRLHDRPGGPRGYCRQSIAGR